MINCIQNHKNFNKKKNYLITNYESEKEKIFNENITFKNKIKERYLDFPLKDNSNHCDPGILFSELSKYIRDDDIISIDTGEHQLWFSEYFYTNKNIRVLSSEHMGTMGFGLCASLATSLNKPNNNSFVIVGDGGFQFSLNELATIKQYGKGKIIIIIINNKILGRVKFCRCDSYSKSEQKGCEIYGPNFVQLVESYGGKGFSVKHNCEIVNTIEECLKSDNKICLINVLINPKLRF